MSNSRFREQRHPGDQGRLDAKASGSGTFASSIMDCAKGGASKLTELGKGAAYMGGRFVRDEGQKTPAAIPASKVVKTHLEETSLDLSSLKGLEVGEDGKIVDKTGRLIGQVIEGDPQDLVGQIVDGDGEILDEDGDLIGRVELVPQEARQEPGDRAVTTERSEGAKGMVESGPILKGRRINKDGKIVDKDGQTLGKVVGQQDPSTLAGKLVNEKGQVLDDDNTVVGKVEILSGQGADTGFQTPQEGNDEAMSGAVASTVQQLPDIASLESLTCDKLGNIVNEAGVTVGQLIEGDAKKLSREGLKLDNEGQFWDNRGHLVGRAKPVSVEQEEEEVGVFAGFGELFVADDGYIQDVDGNRFGRIVDGDVEKLVGRPVDDDGDILDKRGNILGRAEPLQPWEMGWGSEGEGEEEEEEEEEEEQDLSILDGKMVNKLGNVVDDTGAVFGHIVAGKLKRMMGKKVDAKGMVWNDTGEVIGMAELVPREEDELQEGPFFGLSGLVVAKGGVVTDSTGQVMGKLVEGDEDRLLGRAVDEDGEIMDKSGNVIGRAERWTPDEQPQLSPEELEKQQQEAEERALARKMCTILRQTLDYVGSHCRQISQHIQTANSTPKEELDEEQLVKDVRPLIEEASASLQECKGALRSLDPDGQIAAAAKAHSSSREATPEEYELADLLKELTETVVETIDNGKKMIADMPHARRQINPLWALLSEPLFQIIAAVGLLLSGVLGLVGKLLNGLGLGGLLNSLLGGLGIDRLLEGLGLGKVTGSLGLGGKE
ncbi:hypothetical protein IFM58399_08690 [Aspergillus lentulus]|uniref:DUF6987 domain-containing protein n=1 Tax=Aspergillus lentulus TaxID=293939 RepID=A0ABQ1AGU6_ASPLE|nr:uncharacterized protein IFM58399_08690 [Aspergillus lentulus]GFF49972.1 hypothetical protein IFM58399_08690 [Aspergillus lentulus]GFF81450.1 hypothetical protein IFM47457_05472 [Aspergillus lentulus]GFF81656.1 hypothetical protein IFM60648_06096 [Aspergillus lentulus]